MTFSFRSCLSGVFLGLQQSGLHGVGPLNLGSSLLGWGHSGFGLRNGWSGGSGHNEILFGRNCFCFFWIEAKLFFILLVL